MSLTFQQSREREPIEALHQDLSIPDLAGVVYLYATSQAYAADPVAGGRGAKPPVQQIRVGGHVGGEWVAAVRFGVADSGRGPGGGSALLALWANDGVLDHFGSFVRPETPCDFKLRLDLVAHTVTVLTCRRGDADWFLLLDQAPIDSRLHRIDALRIELSPGAPGFTEIRAQSAPWPEGEKVRPHPRERPAPAGEREARGQQMRSTWRDRSGRHVTIARTPPTWFGFPEVVCCEDGTLVIAHNDGRRHGGGGGLFVRRSRDLGRHWDPAIALPLTGVNCPRLQRLRDGSLLLLADLHGAVGLTHFFRSVDQGAHWTRIGELDAARAGGHAAIVPSRVHELDDDSWLVAGSWYPGGKPYEGAEGEQLEFYRSTDRGAAWGVHSSLQAYPKHRHSLSEASILTLKDGRLVLFAREGRGDGFPGVKAFSADHGKTWDLHELPFAITGRTHAGFLPDGRVMLTFRSGIGRQALWAWVGDPLEGPRPSAARGVHFNDADSVDIRHGALRLEGDGHRGQFTQYLFRPPAGAYRELVVTFEALTSENSGRAATVSLPFAGFLRLFPNRIELYTTPSAAHPPIAVQPGTFHTCRVVVRDGRLRLSVDGREMLTTEQLDAGPIVQAWTPSRASVHGLAFGNERLKNWGNHDQAVSHPDVWEPNITPEVTGRSYWRRFEATIDVPALPRQQIRWSARKDGFPDQYQLDHLIEIEASVAGHDQGYSGWTLLPDGRIFVVNYTDDTAPAVEPNAGGVGARMGVSWLRGTYLSRHELPGG